MKIVTSTDRAFVPTLKKVGARGRAQGSAVEKPVKTILQAVEREVTKRFFASPNNFDKVSLALIR
jgi:hypothetical protein